MSLATFKQDNGGDMEKDTNDDGVDVIDVAFHQFHRVADEGAQRGHQGKDYQKQEDLSLAETGLQHIRGNQGRNRNLVNQHSIHHIIVLMDGKPFQKTMDAQTDEQQPRKIRFMFMDMHMAMLGTFGKELQGNLNKDATHDE